MRTGRAFAIAMTTVIVGCGFSVGHDDIGSDDALAAPGRRAPSDGTKSTGTQKTNDASTPTTSTTTDAGVDASDASDAAPKTTGPLKAFVSSAIVTGALGGVAGADKLCNDLAKAQGLPGTYVAWISTTGVNAIDRLTAAGPWERVDGLLVAQTKTQLAQGALSHPLRRDEKNQEPPIEEDRVWTATTSDGTFSGAPDCGGWTGTGTGRVGEAEHLNGQWTSLTDEACTEVNRVYCFQNQ